MTDLTLAPSPNIPPEVRRRIQANERAIAIQQRKEVRARNAWRQSVVDDLCRALRSQVGELWTKTDFEARMLAGHVATLSIHTVDPRRMEELEDKTEALKAEASKPVLYGGDGLPLP